MIEVKAAFLGAIWIALVYAYVAPRPSVYVRLGAVVILILGFMVAAAAYPLLQVCSPSPHTCALQFP